MANYLSGASVLFAFAAAVLWGLSALVGIPIIESGFVGVSSVEPLRRALIKIGKLNAAAAGSAFFSALLQAAALYMSIRIAPS
ncbi:hypothetical protein [Bradyrhizobium sp. S69]|uniref:hypothetical protein n=1 Tax=Bradyrhizobium sp. S69 TaxID=1641856 RepID=UPI00131D6BAB|nr:hypothetical protein [Bradyrhizobium sp. S69]